MSREQNDMYMRSKCDIFLKGLESKMLGQVTHMINTLRTEIYSEVAKIADNFLEESSVTLEKSSVESVAFQASSISPSSHHNSTVISGLDGEFNLPKQQMKKKYRRENKNKVGKVSPSFEAPVAGFCAKVPDAFIYRCSRDTKAEIIQNHLMKNGVNITKVELKSNHNAECRSFKVSVESWEDYDKLLSREFMPRNVKVREFISYKNCNVSKRSPSMSSFIDHHNVTQLGNASSSDDAASMAVSVSGNSTSNDNTINCTTTENDSVFNNILRRYRTDMQIYQVYVICYSANRLATPITT